MNGNGSTPFDPNAWLAQADILVAQLPDPLRQSVGDGIEAALRAHLRNVKPRDRFVLHTAADALKPQLPIEWRIENVISAGSLNLIVGKAKSKKTYAVLDAAVGYALGRVWLGYKTTQGAALIIDEESGARRMMRRLSQVLRGHDAPPTTPIYFTSLAQFNLLDIGDQLALEDLIRQTGAGLVIVDALIDLLAAAGADENDASQVQAVLMALRYIAETTQAAIVVIHHEGKSGVYRGSSAMPGAVDLLLTIESDPKSDMIKFDLTAPRDVEPFTFAAVANFDAIGDTFNLSPADPPQAQEHYSKAETYVMRYVSEHGKALLSAIEDNADACTPAAARRAVYSLVQRGKVRRVNAGGKGIEAEYALLDGSP